MLLMPGISAPLSLFLDADDAALTPATLWSIHSWAWDLCIVIPLAVFALLYIAGAIRQGSTAWLRHTFFASG